MAKVKANTSFAGIVTMTAGEVGEIDNLVILSDLLQAGYVEEIVEAEQPEAPKPSAKKKEKK